MNTKWIWITGASSGIGKSLSRNYASLGFNVIASARSEQKLSELHQEYPNLIHVVPLDVTDSSSRIRALEMVKNLSQTLDIIIHSAGVSQRSKADKTELTVVKQLFEVNFFGLIELNRLTLPLLKKGSVIGVVGSLVSKFSTPYRSAYSASKHALDGYFEGLDYELNGSGIQISMIYPGYIKTDISLNAVKADGSKYGIMDETQANAMSADDCAKRIISGIEKGKSNIFVGGSEIAGVWLKRFFPSILKRIMLKRGITVAEQ